MKDTWNPWHGCTRFSEGCAHCYVYRRDQSVGRDASQVEKTADFALPVRKNRRGEYAIPEGQSLFACLTSDFFLDKADPWREEAWDMIRARRDLRFTIITKRVLRIRSCLPTDWGQGWEHVTIASTVENQRCAEERLGEMLRLPLKKRFVMCEPLLEEVDLSRWLRTGAFEEVVVGGESGEGARILNYDWVLSLRRQCAESGTRFIFKQTGANFVKDGKLYRIERRLQSPQARKAKIDLT